MIKFLLKKIGIIKAYIVKVCKLIINKFDKTDINTSFNSLMPKENIDISNYREALDYIFTAEETIKNIAILGAYGSGKSSIINTYEKQHPEHKFIHVSLAHFNSDNNENKQNNINNLKAINSPAENLTGDNGSNTPRKINVNENSISNLLEGKILNQLIHQIKASNIKDTNFSLKKTLPWYAKLFYSCSICFIVLSAFYVTLYSKWEYWITSNDFKFLEFTLSGGFQLFVLGGCLFALIRLIYSFVSRSYAFNKLKKIGIKSIVDIEVFDSSNKSSFDKHLNEVIYLFQNSTADVIVFEDLDRYDSTMIFEKLREINYLVNKNTNKTIRFFYLIRDDVFNSLDRSKFFDFIIPIVPVVDISNSSDKFSNLLAEANCLEDLDKHFLRDLAYYINDMRLLYNIVNEYQIYRRVINPAQNTNYNANYQLAIIVYKNLFPEDFHALQSGHGYVYDVFKSKEELCKILKSDYKKIKSELSEGLKDFERQKIRNIDELNALYFPINNTEIRISNEIISQGISRVDLVKRIINTENSVSMQKNNYWVSIDVKAEIENMAKNPDYASKLSDIELYSDENLKNTLDKIEACTREINIISTKRINTLIKETGAETFWENINSKYEKKQNSLHRVTSDRNFSVIKYLITNGLLNEDYNLYSSHVYSNELSPTDRGFILSVNEGKQNPFTYELDNPQKVVEHLNPAAFMLSNIHNFDLLEYVLNSQKDNIISTWFKSIDGQLNNNYSFVIEFVKKHLEEHEILNRIFSHRPKWLHVWYSENLINEADFRRILFSIIDACPLNILKEINDDKWLTKKISNDSSYLVADTSNTTKYCEALAAFSVVFNSIVSAEKTKSVLDFVYKNNMYKINTDNIIEVLSIYTKYDIDKDNAKFCSYVYKNSDKPICKYLLVNPNDLINFVLTYSRRKFNDEPNVVLSILNNEKVANEKKIAYMRKSSVKIANLATLSEETLWPEFLRIKAFQPTWRNYLVYFCKMEISNESISGELLNGFVSAKAPSVLRLKNLKKFLGEDNTNKFLEKIIYTKSIGVDDYKRILKEISFSYRSFTFKALENWQIISLMELNCIHKTKENYSFIKQNYANNIYDFLFLGNTKSSFKLIKDKEIILDAKEILNCLSDARIDDEQSKTLLNLYSGNISIENKKYSDEVCYEIINNHFNVEDLPWILKKYQSLGAKTKEIVLEYSKNNSSRIIEIAKAHRNLPAQIYSMLISKGTYTKNILIPLLDSLSDPRYRNLCKLGKSPSFENSEYNIVILNYLKDEGLISSYGEYKGKLRGYPKRKAS